MRVLLELNARSTDAGRLAELFALAGKIDENAISTMVAPVLRKKEDAPSPIPERYVDTAAAANGGEPFDAGGDDTGQTQVSDTPGEEQQEEEEALAVGGEVKAPGRKGRKKSVPVELLPPGVASATPAAAEQPAPSVIEQPTEIAAAPPAEIAATPPQSFVPPGVTPASVAAETVVVPATPVPVEIVVTPQPFIPPGTAPVAQTPATPAAVPAASDGKLTLEDVRECYRQVTATTPAGKVFPFMRGNTWLDGTPKPKWYTVEAVQPEHYDRLLTELSSFGS